MRLTKILDTLRQCRAQGTASTPDGGTLSCTDTLFLSDIIDQLESHRTMTHGKGISRAELDEIVRRVADKARGSV